MKYFTKQWYCDIRSFKKSGDHNLFPHAEDDYGKHYRQIEPYLSDDIKTTDVVMHDRKIEGSGSTGKDYYIYSAGIKLTFVNAEIPEGSIDALGGAYWLRSEIYMRQNRYEMHILFYLVNCESELAEIVIAFDEMMIN
ncbi:MAG: DUF4085 domain-containing protein [Endomicrobia bacterium]|nr:DUF4085 domain-containing protein [Endomicrobiia bacterium]